MRPHMLDLAYSLSGYNKGQPVFCDLCQSSSSLSTPNQVTSLPLVPFQAGLHTERSSRCVNKVMSPACPHGLHRLVECCSIQELGPSGHGPTPHTCLPALSRHSASTLWL